MWLVFPMSSLIERTIHALYCCLDFDEPNWPIIISLKDSQLMFIIQIYYPQEQENIHPTSQTWSSMLSITTPLCLLIIIAISPFPNSMYFDMSLPLNLWTLSTTFSTTRLMYVALFLAKEFCSTTTNDSWAIFTFFNYCCNFLSLSTFLTSILPIYVFLKETYMSFAHAFLSFPLKKDDLWQLLWR